MTPQQEDNMTPQQINWARQHDWFIAANNGQVLVSTYFVDLKTMAHGHQVKVFNNYAKLRRWAGY